jgi:hypothetical protein
VAQAPVLRKDFHAQRRQHTITRWMEVQHEELLQSERDTSRANALAREVAEAEEERGYTGEPPIRGRPTSAAAPRRGKLGSVGLAAELAMRSLSPRHRDSRARRR